MHACADGIEGSREETSEVVALIRMYASVQSAGWMFRRHSRVGWCIFLAALSALVVPPCRFVFVARRFREGGSGVSFVSLGGVVCFAE